MRDWSALLNKDVEKNPELKYYVDNIQILSEQYILSLDIKKDIKKRLLKLKEIAGNKEVILDKKERIEKCISFSYTEDKIGKIYKWKNNNHTFDITGKNEKYDIINDQPFWISDDKKLIKMDTLTFTSINPLILNELEFVKNSTMTEFGTYCSDFRNNLFDREGGEVIDLTQENPSSNLRYTIF